MVSTYPLKAGRGTPLWRNGSEEIRITLSPQSPEKFDYSEILLIIDTLLSPAHHLGLTSREGLNLVVGPDQPFMVMNCSKRDLTVSLSQDPTGFPIVYDPYKFEHESHADFNPDEFKKVHPVPDGYVDTLPKWYSVKYTYPTFNYIFVRPGLGISLQSHKLREEHWEILEGKPLIISDSKVNYDVLPGTHFSMPLGSMHAVINPSLTDWVLLKESYLGEFDEKDIVRIFNPNHYY